MKRIIQETIQDERLTYMCLNCFNVINVHNPSVTVKVDADPYVCITTRPRGFIGDAFCVSCNNCGCSAVHIDQDIVHTVAAFNTRGYKTLYCCSGHYDEQHIDPNVYILFGVDPYTTSLKEYGYEENKMRIYEYAKLCHKNISEQLPKVIRANYWDYVKCEMCDNVDYDPRFAIELDVVKLRKSDLSDGDIWIMRNTFLNALSDLVYLIDEITPHPYEQFDKCLATIAEDGIPYIKRQKKDKEYNLEEDSE